MTLVLYGKRRHELFYTLDKKKVFFYLSGRALFDDSDEIQRKADIESWGRFHIKIDLVTLGNIYMIEGG